MPVDQRGLLTEVVHDKSTNMESLERIFGDLTRRSAYDQYSALLNASPVTVRPFASQAEAVRDLTLLTIKAIALPPSIETGAFSFQLPDKRGFQIGDPHKSRRVNLEVLDINGHYVEIICGTAKETLRLTQPELNRILETLHASGSDSFARHASTSKALHN